MEEALVSVIVPIYNMGNKIESCVRSIMRQDYHNIEIVLVDDGSKDDSYQRCLELHEEDGRVKVFHTKNNGSGPARNYGIEKSKGEYLYFPDADDYIEPNAISILIKYAITTGADMVLCGYRDVDESGKIILEKKYVYAEVSGEDIRNHYAYYKYLNPDYGLRGAPWNKLFKRAIVSHNNIKYPPLRRHQDEAFIARYFCYCQKAVFIEEVLYTYYTNLQDDEWRKYPTDYIDAVRGLFEDRKVNVLKWNPKDIDTKKMIYNEYICNTIKAFELSFSPKFNFTRDQRKKWIQEQASRSNIISYNKEASVGKYQRIILNIIEKEQWNLLYCALHTKVIIAGKFLRKR